MEYLDNINFNSNNFYFIIYLYIDIYRTYKKILQHNSRIKSLYVLYVEFYH